jgi:predicted acyltransferase
MTAVLAAIAVKLALKIVALVAGAIALVRFLIKPGDPVFVRALLAGLGLVLVHTETIVVTTNRLVRADTAADRRRILKSREATTSKLEGELATDLGRLAGGKCNLSVFGSAVPA